MGDASDDVSVPVTIITGFLGAGKTTLLKRILTANHGYRIAVVENEFGEEVGVEKLVARTGDEFAAGDKDGQSSGVVLDDLFVEMSNGCICCAVKDDLVTTLEELVRRAGDRIDYIVIETSGLADPGPLSSIFWLDDELECSLHLDAVITVVDLKNLERDLDNHGVSKGDGSIHLGGIVVNETVLQLAHADYVILNKRDLVSESETEAVIRRIDAFNPLAKKQTAEYGNVPISDILSIFAFDRSAAAARLDALFPSPCNHKGCDHETEASSHHVDHASLHDAAHSKLIGSFTLKFHTPFDLRKLNLFYGELLWEGGNGEANAQMTVLRSKGVVHVAVRHDDDIAPKADDRKHVLQAVRETFEIEATDVLWSSEETPPVSRIVFIGTKLDKDYISRGLENCLFAR